MSKLSEHSKTLLEMAEELQSSDDEEKYTQTKKNIKEKEEKTEIPPSPKLSEQMKIYLKNQKQVPDELKEELIKNQQKLDSFIEQKNARTPKSKKRPNLRIVTAPIPQTPDPTKQTFSPKLRNISSNSLISSPKTSVLASPNQTEIKRIDYGELSPEEKRIFELENQLKQEREMRKILADALDSTVSLIFNKSASVKPSSIKTISQFMEKVKSENAKSSTARLLKQEIESMIKEIPDEDVLPSPIIQNISPKKDSGSPFKDTLVRGCEELAASLTEGFYDEEIKDFGELAGNAVEFARQVNQIKKAHDVGIAELRAQIEVLTERTKKMEELEERGQISDETAKLVDNLTQMMHDFSIQSRREYEDIIENLE